MTAYKKIRGSGRGFGQFSRLWLGEDHLLLVTSTGFVEEYRRFYFADVQAFYIRQTTEGRRWNIFWGFGAGLLTLIALQLSGIGAAIGWAFVVLALLAIGINAVQGPTCICHIKTPTMLHRVPPLTRVRRAQQLLAMIRFPVTQAQGELQAQEIGRLEQYLGGPVPPRRTGVAF